MQILVLGATGNVGSRVVPALQEAGHRVVAASSSAPAPKRFAWGDQVDWVQCDVTDEDAVRLALTDVQGICYLVHSLDRRTFEGRDRRGAQVVRDAVTASGVRRIVYLSGLVPDVPAEDLSRHISSRLEVEEVLAEARTAERTVLSLRAGIVLGAGSTSFEVVRHLATLLLVQPVPSWLENDVQPIAVSDVLRAMVEAFADDRLTGALDIGGPDVLPLLPAPRGVLSGLRAAPGAGAHLLGAGFAGPPRHCRPVRRTVLDRHGPDREPAPRHGRSQEPHVGAAGRPVASGGA